MPSIRANRTLHRGSTAVPAMSATSTSCRPPSRSTKWQDLQTWKSCVRHANEIAMQHHNCPQGVPNVRWDLKQTMGATRSREKNNLPLVISSYNHVNQKEGGPTPRANLHQYVDSGPIASNRNDSQIGQSPQQSDSWEWKVASNKVSHCTSYMLENCVQYITKRATFFKRTFPLH